jgi:putative two-component system response regulator
METYMTLGYDVIENAERHLGVRVEFLACPKEIALNHQGKWDGSGYPRKLAGQDIPISARLMALADVYDALTTHRVYKDAIPHEEAVAIILEGSGRHFDPDVVVAFSELAGEFKVIAGLLFGLRTAYLRGEGRRNGHDYAFPRARISSPTWSAWKSVSSFVSTCQSSSPVPRPRWQ